MFTATLPCLSRGPPPVIDTDNDNPEDARFQLAMASSGIGMAIVSLQGRFLNVNPALCRMLGYPRETLQQLRMQDVTHPEDLVRSEALIGDALAGRSDGLDLEKRYRHRDGHTLWAHVNLGVMRDGAGQPQYFIAQIHDISDRREAERALRELNDTLEQRVEARTAELQVLNKQLELFAFGVSHDLRAPLRTIDSFAAILQQQHAAQLDADGHAHLQRIRAASGKMAGLIDGLLELSRASRAELRQDTVDLSLLAEWVGAELQEAEPERSALIRVQPGLAAVGDERLLKGLLVQLMGNAWQFSRGRERVRIEVGGHRDAAGLQLWVRDWGSGFGKEYADTVFEPFKRVHGPEQGGGNGLGLAIARRIVERHGGSIGAEPVLGAGTTIRVILPAGGRPRQRAVA